MKTILNDIAYARSGDKGNNSNIGLIAKSTDDYAWMVKNITAERVKEYFHPLGVTSVVRYELPNLEALNFILYDALDGGGSRSLRLDAQGKALGQVLLQMPIEVYPL